MRNIPVDRKAGAWYALGVQPKANRETGEQLTSREGHPQWLIEVLYRPNELRDGSQPASEVERVTVPSPKAPELAPMTQVDLPGLVGTQYNITDGPSGVALRADAVKAL